MGRRRSWRMGMRRGGRRMRRSRRNWSMMRRRMSEEEG